jgi:hypothetical protein
MRWRRSVSGSRDSCVSMVTRLRHWTAVVQFPARQDFSLRYRDVSGPPSQLSIGNEVVSSRAKRPGREADHSPPDSAEFMNLWRYTATPHNCMLWCSVKYQGHLYLGRVSSLTFINVSRNLTAPFCMERRPARCEPQLVGQSRQALFIHS